MDDQPQGVLIDFANRYLTGHFWKIGGCPDNGGPGGQESDNLVYVDPTTLLPGLLKDLGDVIQTLTRDAIRTAFGTPVDTSQPAARQKQVVCNQQPLTPLGAFVIKDMIRRRLLIEIDHMDVLTGKAALRIAIGERYSGVISAHGWDTPDENKMIYSVGGFVTPSADGDPASFVARWRTDAGDHHYGYLFGFGYGSDMNGLAEQATPDMTTTVKYPFTSLDGRVTFQQERWGARVFNFNPRSGCSTDSVQQCGGVSNYGMYADWLQAVRVAAGTQGNAIMTDMSHGAEAYLEMWERAAGVAQEHCLAGPQVFDSLGLVDGPRLGDTFQDVLKATGQPLARLAWSYRYCAAGRPAQRPDVRTVFLRWRNQPVGLIASTDPGASAGGIAVGTPLSRVERVARLIRRGVWWEHPRPGGSQFVFGVRDRVVTFVGVSSAAGNHLPTLLRELREAGLLQ
jgi:hypothetical protein